MQTDGLKVITAIAADEINCKSSSASVMLYEAELF